MKKGKGVGSMVWAAIWGNNRRSDLIQLVSWCGVISARLA